MTQKEFINILDNEPGNLERIRLVKWATQMGLKEAKEAALDYFKSRGGGKGVVKNLSKIEKKNLKKYKIPKPTPPKKVVEIDGVKYTEE
jgi:hypothetical protein